MVSPRKITLGHLDISPKGKEYVNDALNSNRLSAGKYTARFESEFANLHGCNHGVFCNSGTSALQIALAALKERYHYRDGDEVIVPATTFIATSNIVLQNGLRPIFADVNPRTYNMDPGEIERMISPRTCCIIPVHLFGLPADMPSIMTVARRHKLQVIEDSCETMFADINTVPVGCYGDMACFSTYVAHLIVGGVGGLVTTNDSSLAEVCRSLMAHGRDSIYTNIDADDDASLAREMIQRRYKFDRVGYSYRATELEAAIALSELERYKTNMLIRRSNAKALTQLLSDLPQFQLPWVPSGYTHSFMMYPMVMNIQSENSSARDLFLMYLEEHGIETRLLFPLLSQPVYQRLFPNMDKYYPVARHLAKQGFFIGMHQGLEFEDIKYISEVIHGYVAQGISNNSVV